MRDDPFAKLGALDQKLFTKPTSPPAGPASDLAPAKTPDSQGTKKPWNQASKEPSKQGSLEASNLASREPRDQGSMTSHPPLSLNTRPERQNTYAFTTEELNRLEDVKIAITRGYDLSVTKNDLIRCAVHMLLEDYESCGAESALLKRLRKKQSR